MSSHPFMIAGLTALALIVVGIVAAVMREVRLFGDFRDIAPEAKTIANQLRAEVFRDGGDLVLSGQYHGIPTVVRFSQHVNAPAVGVYVRIPAPFQFSLVPKPLASGSLSSNVKVRSQNLERRFIVRSASADELELLLASDKNVKLLETLCSSNKTILEANRGRLELLEMAIPEELGRNILDRLAAIRELADSLAAMPGSDSVEVIPLLRESNSWFAKAAVAAAVVVVAMSVIAATREHAKVQASAPVDSELVHGVPEDDASLISGIDQWRAARSDEIDSDFAGWVRDSGQKPSSRIEFNPVADQSFRGVAYLLVRGDGTRRLVVLVDHHAVFDTCFSRIAGIARVPLSSFPKLKWGQWQTPAQKPDGDAILFVRDAADPRSAELLFFPNGTLFTGVPRDYSTINLQHGVLQQEARQPTESQGGN